MGNNYFDLDMIKHDVNFKTPISHGLYWVPHNILGKTRFTNHEIKEMAVFSPEKKRERLECVYEIIQLFQLNRFVEEIDVWMKDDGEREWEYHHTGYHAIRYNAGCCSSIACAATYLLKDNYESMGYLGFFRPNCTGHVFNYILKDGNYFLFDLSVLTWENRLSVAKETGVRMDFFGNIVTSICVQTDSLYKYAKYLNRIQKYGGFEFLFYQYEGVFDAIPPMALENINGVVHVYVSSLNTIRFLNDSKGYCIHLI